MRKLSLLVLVLFFLSNVNAGTSKNRPTMPRDGKPTMEKPKRGPAPWPIPR
jgi:hypothetical protein